MKGYNKIQLKRDEKIILFLRTIGLRCAWWSNFCANVHQGFSKLICDIYLTLSLPHGKDYLHCRSHNLVALYQCIPFHLRFPPFPMGRSWRISPPWTAHQAHKMSSTGNKFETLEVNFCDSIDSDLRCRAPARVPRALTSGDTGGLRLQKVSWCILLHWVGRSISTSKTVVYCNIA